MQTPYFDSEYSEDTKGKSFVRINSKGELQLIQIYPHGDRAEVYLDEDGPHLISLIDLIYMLRGSNCRSLDEMVHWKQMIH